jgi:hypothetical protein
MTHQVLMNCGLKQYKCSKCLLNKACVVKLKDTLVCVKCLYEFMGKDAFYQPLYTGFDK